MATLNRSATAKWHGTVREGGGSLSVQSGVLAGQPYTFRGRFDTEDGRAGTNPEELIAAALAGCFTMALSAELTRVGHPPHSLQTNATVSAQKSESGEWSITSAKLRLIGKVEGVDGPTFTKQAEQVLRTCPVSRALRIDTSVDARLA